LRQNQSLSDSIKLADLNNINKEFLPKKSSPKKFSQKILIKNPPKKILQKRSSKKDPPKKILQKILPKKFL
jgi:hypothetical protein